MLAWRTVQSSIYSARRANFVKCYSLTGFLGLLRGSQSIPEFVFGDIKEL